MAKLRIPSVQHLARHWYDSPKKIEDEFVKMAMNPPLFNYNALNDIARDCLLFKVPEDQITKGIKEKEKRKTVQKVLLGVFQDSCRLKFKIMPPCSSLSLG